MWLREQTMNPHLLVCGLPVSEEAHMSRILHHYPHAKIVIADGGKAGLIKVLQSGRQWELVQIQITPSLQGQGLGKLLLEDLIAEATKQGAELHLSVLKANPALRLYERLGFVIVAEDEHSHKMVRNSLPAPTHSQAISHRG